LIASKIMSEVHLKFEREDREGVVAVGTYLIDAAKRFGIAFDGECVQNEGIHFCSLTVPAGASNLSPLTSVESKHFAAGGRKSNERLACQVKISSPGEVVVMTNEKKDKSTEKVDEQNEQYRKEFKELPLEKKLAALVQLEAIALGETFSFIFNSPYMVFDKVMDVMAEFGLNKEQQNKQSARPKEHHSAQANPGEQAEHRKKGSSRKSGVKPKPTE